MVTICGVYVAVPFLIPIICRLCGVPFSLEGMCREGQVSFSFALIICLAAWGLERIDKTSSVP